MSLVVKSHHPVRRRVILALVVFALAISGYALFEYGRFSAGYDRGDVNQRHDKLNNQLNKLETNIGSLREQQAVLESSKQIERKAYDELDITLKVLQSEILELKGELAFYRGIVSPKDAAQGLHLQRFRVKPNGKSRGFRYKVILTQVLKNSQFVRGSVRINIEGLQGKEAKVLKLSEVTAKPVKDLEYRFRYFQSMEGELALPSGFTPHRVTVTVVPRGRSNKQQSIEKTFDWPV